MKIEGKVAFMFYMNWEQQVDLMTDVELRRFIKNLCRYAEGEPIELPTREEKLCWLGIVPALEINDEKYEKKVKANRENGKLGGAPMGNQNASKEKTTQNNPEQPKQPDKREQINDNSKMEIDNRKMTSDKGEQKTDNSKMENETNKTKNLNGVPTSAGGSSSITKSNSGISMHEFYKQRGL